MVTVTKQSGLEYYANPEQVKGGKRLTPPVRPAMKGHVPVRFPEGVVEQVKVVAQQDGVTVSTWIRQLVTRELERRITPSTATIYSPKWVRGAAVESTTGSAGSERIALRA